jgi:hypothetical protein
MGYEELDFITGFCVHICPERLYIISAEEEVADAS